MTKKMLLIQSIVVPSLLVLAVAFSITGNALGAQFSSPKRAVLSVEKPIYEFDREGVLVKFFESFGSPLKSNAKTFVDVADKYGIDYRYLPAIACMESSCGKNLIPGTYNPFGWGIYGSNYISFASYDEAIEAVGRGLRVGYFDKGLDTLEEIAPVYTPPRYQHWLSGVSFFVGRIGVVEGNM